MDLKPVQTRTSLHELSEIKNGCYKTYMVTCQFGDWWKVNPLKKENVWQKSFFQIMLNEVLKICEKWCLLM